MGTREARVKAAGERLAGTFGRAARAHERALLVEIWAAEYFELRGKAQAAARHRQAAQREAEFAENCYARLSQGFETAPGTIG